MFLYSVRLDVINVGEIVNFRLCFMDWFLFQLTEINVV